MLSTSTRLIHANIRILRVAVRFSHLENRTDNKVKSEIVIRNDFKERLMKVSNTALTRYNEIIGFDEIDREYKRITELQEDLAKCQNDRTNLQLQINHIQANLSNLQNELQDHKRGEQKYIELMKREFEIIQERTRLEEKFEILDNKEREMFGHLQSKINLLHDKSRTHTRQWGIISTIIGALLGVIGTSISAYYRNNDIRKIQKNFQTQFQDQIEKITKDTHQIIEGYNNLVHHLNQFEVTPKKHIEELKVQESWGGYLKRKTVAVWRWCTFQK